MHGIRLNCGLLLSLLLFGCVAAGPQPNTPKKQANVHYQMGVSDLQANNPTMALKEFLLAVKEDPENSSIQAALAQAYQLKKAYPEAEQHYLKALEYSHDDPSFQNNLGALYLDMQQWDKAIEYFDKAAANLLFLSPQVALTGKGYAYFRKHDLQTAISCYKQALSMAPNYAPAYYRLSEVYHEQDNPLLEQQALERSLEIAPQYVQAHYQLGVLLLKQQKTEEATQHFKKILELAPNSELALKAADLLRSLPKS